MKRFAVSAGVLVLGLMLGGCAQRVALFNGENLNGWTPFLADDTVDPATVWSVRDGVLRCEGQPNGYIRTVGAYSDYTLLLEWRWPETPSNSGVLLHATGEDKLWPQCIEAQLKHLSAGDLVTIQPGSTVTVNDVAYQPEGSIFKIIPKRLPTSEKLAGNWNRYKIVCKGDTINLYVNGVHQHSATHVSPAAGAICLQSEGSPIEFRNIVLTPLKP